MKKTFHKIEKQKKNITKKPTRNIHKHSPIRTPSIEPLRYTRPFISTETSSPSAITRPTMAANYSENSSIDSPFRGQCAIIQREAADKRTNPMAAIISARRTNTFVAEFNRFAISAVCREPMGSDLVSRRFGARDAGSSRLEVLIKFKDWV